MIAKQYIMSAKLWGEQHLAAASRLLRRLEGLARVADG